MPESGDLGTMMLGGMISSSGRQHLKTVGEHEQKKTHSGNENERRKRNLEIGHDVDYRGPEPGESDDSVKLVDPGGPHYTFAFPRKV